MMLQAPVAGKYDNQGKTKIYNNSRNGKKDINAGMFPLIVMKGKQWESIFYQPENRYTTGEQ